jgi:hypothetical protein
MRRVRKSCSALGNTFGAGSGGGGRKRAHRGRSHDRIQQNKKVVSGLFGKY